MQYVGRALGSVSKTWSSINPATLSGAIDVIVVEQPDGTLSCSPFHVRFGKFQILKPSQKKVEVLVNGKSTNIPMKLSDSGEAYFVFETSTDVKDIPDDLLASPVMSATNSPPQSPEPSKLELNSPEGQSDQEHDRSSDSSNQGNNNKPLEEPDFLDIGASPNSKNKTKIFQQNLNKRLTQIHIPSKLENNGDLLLDMEGYKPNTDMMHDTDMQLKQLLKDELGSESDISNFIREDSNGNVRIVNPYENCHLTSTSPIGSAPGSPLISASEPTLTMNSPSTNDSAESVESEELSSDTMTNEKSYKESLEDKEDKEDKEERRNSSKHFIKTIRLTSDQLRCLDLIYGENDLTFSIDHGKATMAAKLFVWRWDVPIVISDIDGTITKSDALGHVLAMIGKDWTHIGVAKLFTEIARNGYNILYLTARGAGQADSTRGYLRSIYQGGNRLPVGPVILSPDRTMAALRREIILKKPEIFKIACLNDIRSLYFEKFEKQQELEREQQHKEEVETKGEGNISINSKEEDKANEANDIRDTKDPVIPNQMADEKPTPFFAGFGNRITDALSYRTVGIPSSRIFTINPDGDVHMELLELAGYRSSYIHINELVDHFFPPVNLNDDDIRSVNSMTPGSPINKSLDNIENTGGIDNKSFFRTNQEEKFTDVNFWREPILDLDELSDISNDSSSIDEKEKNETSKNTRLDVTRKNASRRGTNHTERSDTSIINNDPHSKYEDETFSTPKRHEKKRKKI
ncbi:hypothetical protein NCAS_0D00920 [Naumovozyma castellii]|uniref:LNS2/PITP domain-containing protein n=1 Tax=Naumovozyma castellii TaxID=27288 RepID=G0VDN5_NAUCA|nr:hypothetical protein NCAS_0D00920 [Naumovozyma castellii CBS 4309]CCC69673.1 hypothetical protein NCAS_0D00920 [Naumovozyma castellii CBS 4309]